MTPRQRRIALANAVRARIANGERFALSWTDQREVVGRYMDNNRARYLTLPMGDDEATVETFVAWIHADSPRTS